MKSPDDLFADRHWLPYLTPDVIQMTAAGITAAVPFGKCRAIGPVTLSPR
jgi:hypothetical protein